MPVVLVGCLLSGNCDNRFHVWREGDNRHYNEGRGMEIVATSQSQTGNSHLPGSLFM